MRRDELSEVEGTLLGAYELIVEDQPYGLQDVKYATRSWTPTEREKFERLVIVGRWLKDKVDA